MELPTPPPDSADAECIARYRALEDFAALNIGRVPGSERN
jgi:hypothetical protein